jgi:hypothetical protein
VVRCPAAEWDFIASSLSWHCSGISVMYELSFEFQRVTKIINKYICKVMY